MYWHTKYHRISDRRKRWAVRITAVHWEEGGCGRSLCVISPQTRIPVNGTSSARWWTPAPPAIESPHPYHIGNTSTHGSQFPQSSDTVSSTSFTPLLQTHFRTSPFSIELPFFSQNKNIQPSTPEHSLPDPTTLGYTSFLDLPFLPAWNHPRAAFLITLRHSQHCPCLLAHSLASQPPMPATLPFPLACNNLSSFLAPAPWVSPPQVHFVETVTPAFQMGGFQTIPNPPPFTAVKSSKRTCLRESSSVSAFIKQCTT